MVQKFVNHKRLTNGKGGQKTQAVDGYRIEVLDVDPRDIYENRYECIMANKYFSTVVVVFVPAFSASFFEDEEAEQFCYLAEDVDRATQKNAIKGNVGRRTKPVLIVFPETVSNHIFSPDSTDGKVDIDVRCFLSQNMELEPDKFGKIPKYNVFWYLSVLDDESRILNEKKAEKSAGSVAFRKAFERMSMGQN